METRHFIPPHGVDNLLLDGTPTRYRLPQQPTTCRRRLHRSAAGVRPGTDTDPAEVDQGSEVSRQSGPVHGELPCKLADTLAFVTRYVNKQRILRELQSHWLQRAIVEPCEKATGFSQPPAGARQIGQRKRLEGILAAPFLGFTRGEFSRSHIDLDNCVQIHKCSCTILVRAYRRVHNPP